MIILTFYWLFEMFMISAENFSDKTKKGLVEIHVIYFKAVCLARLNHENEFSWLEMTENQLENLLISLKSLLIPMVTRHCLISLVIFYVELWIELMFIPSEKSCLCVKLLKFHTNIYCRIVILDIDLHVEKNLALKFNVVMQHINDISLLFSQKNETWF